MKRSDKRLRRKFFQRIAILTGVLLWLLLSHTANAQHNPAHEQNHKASTYILAVGCCVSYMLPRAEVCAHTAESFARLFVEKLEVPEKNLRLLVNKQATYEAVTKGLVWLSEVAGPEDTVIFYYNGHGTLLEDYEGDEEYGMDEVFILWSEDEPFSVLYAVANKIWLIDDELGEFIRAIHGGKVIIIADTCHASEAERGIYPPGAIVDYHQEMAALMSSARADQVSLFDVDRKMGLFTAELLKAVRAGDPNLKTAFTASSREVQKLWPECAKRIGMDKYTSGQTPTLTDPSDVAAQIYFSGDGQ